MLFPSLAQRSPAPRVVVTGAGILTALGVGWKPNAEGFRRGKTAFRPVSLFDVSSQRVKTAAEEDLPLVLGTTAGGMTLGEAYFRQATQLPHAHLHQATRAVHYQPQVQARMVLDSLGFSGPITIISTACAAGSNAVGYAWELIRR